MRARSPSASARRAREDERGARARPRRPGRPTDLRAPRVTTRRRRATTAAAGAAAPASAIPVRSPTPRAGECALDRWGGRGHLGRNGRLRLPTTAPPASRVVRSATSTSATRRAARAHGVARQIASTTTSAANQTTSATVASRFRVRPRGEHQPSRASLPARSGGRPVRRGGSSPAESTTDPRRTRFASASAASALATNESRRLAARARRSRPTPRPRRHRRPDVPRGRR